MTKRSAEYFPRKGQLIDEVVEEMLEQVGVLAPVIWAIFNRTVIFAKEGLTREKIIDSYYSQRKVSSITVN